MVLTLAFWRWLRRPEWPRAFIAGTALGLAGVCKFTLLIFYPLLLLGETMAESGSLPAAPAVLAGNVVVLLVSSFLTGRLLFR